MTVRHPLARNIEQKEPDSCLAAPHAAERRETSQWTEVELMMRPREIQPKDSVLSMARFPTLVSQHHLDLRGNFQQGFLLVSWSRLEPTWQRGSSASQLPMVGSPGLMHSPVACVHSSASSRCASLIQGSYSREG